MALYRSVLMGFWTDTKVVDEFTPEDRYFYLYLFTNPHTNLCGCYEISIKQVANEIGYSADTAESLLIRFEKVHNVIRYSMETKEVLLLNWHKYNWTASDKFRVAVSAEIERVKDGSFKAYLVDVLDGADTVSIPYPYGMDTSNANANTNTVTVNNTSGKKIEKRGKRFTPPTLEEVAGYCFDRGNNIDPQAFIDYYASQKWRKANGRQVADWKACVRTWEALDKKREPDRGTTKPVIKKNAFTRFDQREYDENDLELQLLEGVRR